MGPQQQEQKSFSHHSCENCKNSHATSAANPLMRLGQWLRELPANFELPRSESPNRVRSLSDPIWRPMTADEIAARGDGWNADYSQLKQMYGDITENASEPINPRPKSPGLQSKILPPKQIHNEEQLTLSQSRYQDGVGDVTLHNSTSSNTTLCNPEGQIESMEDDLSGSSASSSVLMETASESLATSSEYSFHTADSQMEFVQADQKQEQEDFEPDEFPDYDSKSYQTSSDVCRCDSLHEIGDDNSDVTTISDELPLDYADELPQHSDIPQNASLMGAPWLGNGMHPHTNTLPLNGTAIAFPYSPLIHVQPIVQRLPLAHTYMPTLSPWHMACVNSAYNNFMALQWSTAARPFLIYDQPTIPLISQSIPIVPTVAPFLCPSNIILTAPNVPAISSSMPLYDRATLFRMLQQQLLLQRQQIAASGVILQQQQQHQQHQQHQQLHQHQQQHQHQRPQIHPYRNSRYRRPTQNVTFVQTNNFNNNAK